MANRDFKVRHGLDVCGNTSLGGDVAISGNLDVGGNLSLESADLSGGLQVSGSASLGSLKVAGMTSLQGGLVVDTSMNVQTTLQANSISASGQLQVDGTTSLKNTLTVSGMTSLQGGLVVDGESDFQAKLSANTISASGQVIVDQQVQADGDIIAGQTLRAVGSLCAQAQAFVNQNLRVTGNSDLNGTLTVCGDTTLSSTLQVKGNASISGTTVLTGGVQALNGLDVSGTIQATAHVSSGGYLHAGTTLQVSGSASLGSLKVAGMTSLQGGLVVDTSMDVQTTLNANTISASGQVVIGGQTNPSIELQSNTSGLAYIDFGRRVGGVAQDYGGRIILDGDTTLSICAQQLHFRAQNICLDGTVQVKGNISVGGGLKVAQSICANQHVIAGDNNTGRIGLSINDGYGNANLTFNHHAGIPDVAGNAARIETNVDSTTSSFIALEVGSGLQAQTAQALQNAATFYANRTQINGTLEALGNADIAGGLQVSGTACLGGLKVAGTTCLQAAVDINQTLAVSGAISAPGGIHAVAGNIQTTGAISGTQLKFVSAGGQRMTVSNLDSVSGRVGTLSATKFNWTSAGGQRMTISSATITSLNVSTITVNQQGNIARRISGTVASTNAGYVTAFTVNGNNLASCVEVFFEGTIANVVVSCYAEIVVNHSGDISIRTHQGQYTPLDIQVISNNSEDFAVLVKRNGGAAGTANLNFNVYPKGDETVTATATNPYSGTTFTHTGVRGTKTTATGGNPHRFETDGEIIGKQTLTVSGMTSLQGGLVVDTSMDVQVAAQMNNISSSGSLVVQGTTVLSGAIQAKNTLSVAGSSVLSGAVQAKNGISVGGSGTIAAATWANGHLRIGSATAGIAMDPNEIYFAGTGNLGTISGNLNLNPAGAITTGKVFDSTANIQTTAIISGTQLRCTSFAGTTADVAGTLQVSGNASLGSLRVAGVLSAQGGLVIDTSFDCQTKLSADTISASGQVIVDQQVQADGSILAGQTLRAGGNLCAQGNAIINGTGTFRGAVNVSGTLSARKYSFEPYGVVPTYSNSNYGTIKYNSTESAIELQGSDTAIGMAFPAWKVNVNSGNKWQITIQIRASANTTGGGVYVRLYEYDAELPNGKIAVSNSATNALVQEDTRQKAISPTYENRNASTAWQTLTFEYTPTGSAVWASIVVLNWTGLGTNALYVREPQIKQKLVKVPDADLLDGENLVDGAATANTVVGRNGSGDIFARLIRQTYGNQSTISGGLVFRVNNSSDNYLRVCSSQSAIRTFLGVTATAADTNYLRSNANDIFEGTTSGRYLRFQCVSGRTANSSSGNLFPLEVYQATVNTDAAMTFHIGSDYAAYFGLDGTTNDLFFGGWSRGAAKYKIWHAANDGSGSGLDADLLDGIQGSSFLRSDVADTFTQLNASGSTNTGRWLSRSSWGISCQTSNGYIQIGPANTSYAHIYSDRPSFYFNKQLLVTGSTVWNAGNDGSGSGLDADTLDGAQPSVSAGNNTIVKRHSSGYIFANYFNTTPNDVSSGITKICCETGNDGYIRHATAGAVRAFIGDSRYLRSDANDTATGIITFNSIVNIRAALDLADSDILRLGSSDDWELFHNGVHNYMDLNNGDLIIRDNTKIRWWFRRVSGAFQTYSVDTAILASTSAATASNGSALVRNTNNSIVNSTVLNLQTYRSNNAGFSFLRTTSNVDGTGDNEHILRGDGNAFADGTWNSSGADYAEYFEWLDGNNDNEDRRGICVVLEGNKIRPANEGEDPIGVISGNPSVVGDAAWSKWTEKYLKDDYNSYIMEDHSVIEWEETKEVEDENGDMVETTEFVTYEDCNIPENVIIPENAVYKTHDENGMKFTHRKLNPDYDPNHEYISREERPEWDAVGLVGKLRVRKGQVMGSRWIKMRDINNHIEEWLVR